VVGGQSDHQGWRSNVRLLKIKAKEVPEKCCGAGERW
jgi:hypothetical protein